MDKAIILLENGQQKEVDGILYIYNSKYYFIYTEKEIDENGYVILSLVQVGKEVKNTPEGNIDTGNMIGLEIADLEEWKQVQTSITKMVDDKKMGTVSSEIQYLPIGMLSNLKIVSKKTFRLMKSIIKDVFKLNIEDAVNATSELPSIQTNTIGEVQNVVVDQPISIEPVAPTVVEEQSMPIDQTLNMVSSANESGTLQQSSINDTQILDDNNVIIDYRAKFFEEQEKNKQLQSIIDDLNEKINNIKNIIE